MIEAECVAKEALVEADDDGELKACEDALLEGLEDVVDVNRDLIVTVPVATAERVAKEPLADTDGVSSDDFV